MNEIHQQSVTRVLPRFSAVTEIAEAVAAVYMIGVADITGRERTKAVAEARLAVYVIARRCTRLSFPEIGTALGGRDHTTVMSGLKSAEQLRRKDRWFASTVAELLERFGEIEESVTQ